MPRYSVDLASPMRKSTYASELREERFSRQLIVLVGAEGFERSVPGTNKPRFLMDLRTKHP